MDTSYYAWLSRPGDLALAWTPTSMLGCLGQVIWLWYGHHILWLTPQAKCSGSDMDTRFYAWLSRPGKLALAWVPDSVLDCLQPRLGVMALVWALLLYTVPVIPLVCTEIWIITCSINLMPSHSELNCFCASVNKHLRINLYIQGS